MEVDQTLAAGEPVQLVEDVLPIIAQHVAFPPRLPSHADGLSPQYAAVASMHPMLLASRSTAASVTADPKNYHAWLLREPALAIERLLAAPGALRRMLQLLPQPLPPGEPQPSMDDMMLHHLTQMAALYAEQQQAAAVDVRSSAGNDQTQQDQQQEVEESDEGDEEDGSWDETDDDQDYQDDEECDMETDSDDADSAASDMDAGDFAVHMAAAQHHPAPNGSTARARTQASQNLHRTAFEWRGLPVTWHTLGVAIARGWCATVRELLEHAKDVRGRSEALTHWGGPLAEARSRHCRSYIVRSMGRSSSSEMLSMVMAGLTKPLEASDLLPGGLLDEQVLISGIVSGLEAGSTDVASVRSFQLSLSNMLEQSANRNRFRLDCFDLQPLLMAALNRGRMVAAAALAAAMAHVAAPPVKLDEAVQLHKAMCKAASRGALTRSVAAAVHGLIEEVWQRADTTSQCSRMELFTVLPLLLRPTASKQSSPAEPAASGASQPSMQHRLQLAFMVQANWLALAQVEAAAQHGAAAGEPFRDTVHSHWRSAAAAILLRALHVAAGPASSRQGTVTKEAILQALAHVMGPAAASNVHAEASSTASDASVGSSISDAGESPVVLQVLQLPDVHTAVQADGALCLQLHRAMCMAAGHLRLHSGVAAAVHQLVAGHGTPDMQKAMARDATLAALQAVTSPLDRAEHSVQQRVAAALMALGCLEELSQLQQKAAVGAGSSPTSSSVRSAAAAEDATGTSNDDGLAQRWGAKLGARIMDSIQAGGQSSIDAIHKALLNPKTMVVRVDTVGSPLMLAAMPALVPALQHDIRAGKPGMWRTLPWLLHLLVHANEARLLQRLLEKVGEVAKICRHTADAAAAALKAGHVACFEALLPCLHDFSQLLPGILSSARLSAQQKAECIKSVASEAPDAVTAFCASRARMCGPALKELLAFAADQVRPGASVAEAVVWLHEQDWLAA